MNQKKQLLACADKMQELADLLEPLFKAGHKNFAPDTDWWSIIAGMRHINLADIRMMHDFAQCIDERNQKSPPTVDEIKKKGYWDRKRYEQREQSFLQGETNSPCVHECLLTWRNSYGCKNTPRDLVIDLSDIDWELIKAGPHMARSYKGPGFERYIAELEKIADRVKPGGPT